LNFGGPLRLVNKVVGLGPVVRVAARFVGRGPSRLKMVRLSHELNHDLASPQGDDKRGDRMSL